MILSRIVMCLTILLMEFPIIRRVKHDKWYKFLLLIPPVLFVALIAAKAYDFVIPVGQYTWNVNMIFPLIIIQAINLVYVAYISKKEVTIWEWLIIPAIIFVDIFVKIIFGLFTQNGFNFFNNFYATDNSQILFSLSYMFTLYTTIFLLITKDWGKRIWAAKAILVVFGYVVSFTVALIQTAINVSIRGRELSIGLIGLFVVIFLLVVLMVIFLVYEINKWYMKEKEKEQNKIEQIEEYYDKQLILNQEELIKLKHDMNNFLEIIRLKDEEAYQELKDKVQKYNAVYFCKDELLNKILVLKVSEGKKFDIEFNIHIDVTETLPMHSVDMISLFTNILDNAIDAAKSSKSKTINLDVAYSDNILNIALVNSCDQIKPKEDKIYHGKGKEIVKDILNKYNGTSNVYYANKMYSLEMTLSCQK